MEKLLKEYGEVFIANIQASHDERAAIEKKRSTHAKLLQLEDEIRIMRREALENIELVNLKK